MPIIRKKLSHEYRFTQVPNEWIRDRRLSLKAKGLLAQLLSHTSGWEVSIERLASVNNCGKDLIRSAVLELETNGYLERLEQTREGGKFDGKVWITSEPSAGLPSSGLPTAVFPTTVNPTPKKTIVKKTISKKTITKGSLDSDFESFWSSYPRKVGKATARKAFEKALESAAVSDILEGVARFATDPNLPDTQFIPYPATWLNREGWGDEPYPKREAAPNGRVEPKSPHVGGPREWVLDLHDAGEHWECRAGEFGCK
jgi:hypothetical protein